MFAADVGSGPKWVTLSTLNEWGEGDTLEPTRDFGAKYHEGGNYQHDFMEAIREVFGQ